MSSRSGEMFAQEGVFEAAGAENEPLSVQNTIRRYHDSLIQCLRQRLRVPKTRSTLRRKRISA